ncbi:MAG TPA: DegQ family serine endoprotease [Steroidobacteraceae bacterium]|nr:DegQ family serine endoprotease [Steroidobacteraceae bacterium]
MSFEWSARRAGILFFTSVALAACSGSSRAQTGQTGAPPLLRGSHSSYATAGSCGPLSAAQLPDFSALVERYGPAVVNVQVVEHSQSAAGGGDSGDESDDPFNDFFRRFGIPSPNTPRNMPPQRGTGSGFIVSPDGYILTNAHVVQNADEVTVKLIDRREFRARVIGIDDRTDVAVIKIDGHSLPVVKIGDASKLKPGQWVVAIGSPFDFDNSATAGIVSATARPLPSEANNYVSFIQTDVPINPGNSGGPLFNVKGEVVGINSQIFSQTGGYMGLSFAIPIDVAVNVEEQIIHLGHVVRGRIGVLIQDVTAQLAESFGLDRPRGALVSSVEPGGPADKAGIKPGDVILAVNGQTIERYGELSSRISNSKPGSEVRLSVWRNRTEAQLDVHVALLNEREERTASRSLPGRGSDQAAKLGLTVRPLTPDERQQAQTEGSLIVEQASGPAAAAGVQPGDVILGVNGKSVRSLSELDQATKAAGKTFALRIQRQDAQIYVPLELP